MTRGNIRGGRGRGRGGFRGSGGFRGGRGAFRGVRGGFGGPPVGHYDDGYYNYGPPILPPLPPQRLPPPPLPPVPPRSLMRGMPSAHRPPIPFGGFRHPGPPMRPPRLGFMVSMRGRGRGGRVLKIKNVNGGPSGFKRGAPAKKLSEKMMNAEIKKPWMTSELEAEIKKKYELFSKTKTTPPDETYTKAFKEQEAIVANLNVELRTKYTKVKDAFSCEPCCRGFPSQEALDSHLSEHVSCGIEGCSLSAHPRILDVHIRYQHRTGLFKQISGAEVEKWISDRKKRFPTLKTVMEKEQAKDEMDRRGETYTMSSHNSTSSRNGSDCSALDTKNNIQKNDDVGGLNFDTQSNFTFSNPAMKNSTERSRKVKRGGKSKKKPSQRTLEKDMCHEENEEESGPTFVKIKKFCGLGTLFERSSDIVNENNKDTLSYPDKSLTVQNSTVFYSNQEPNIKLYENVQMMAQSNCVFRKNSDSPTKESSAIIEQMCNGKVQSNEYKNYSNEVAKPVTGYLSKKIEVDEVNKMDQKENISTDLIEGINIYNEIKTVQVDSNHIVKEESRSTEINETNSLNNEVNQRICNSQNILPNTKDSSKANLNHVKDIDCQEPSTVDFNGSVRIVDETCQEMDTNENALTTLMASYVDDESEKGVDEPPTESPICKSETELELSLTKYGNDNYISERNVVSSNRVHSYVILSKKSGNAIENVDNESSCSEIPVNSCKGTSDIISERDSNKKRRHGEDLDIEQTKKLCDRTALRMKKAEADPFDTFADGKTTLRRHRGTNLLEKLLEDDIVHERNVILQCAHYIVKNKFFDEI